MIPYGRHSVDEEDIQAVVEALRSDWLTTGPRVEEFERAVAAFCGVEHAVAVSNGTAGLHAAMYGAGIGPGDEVIVPPLTFAATANAVLYVGATPVFADVDPETLLIDPVEVAAKIGPKTKAILAVDYAGQPCDYASLRALANKHNLKLIADACHSIGAEDGGRKVGLLADASVLSFHPVKHITTGEGGMILTNDATMAARMKLFRSHGISSDHRQRASSGTWHYEMVDLGYNYRICDIQCALGISQMKKLPRFLERRNEIAQRYDSAFKDFPAVRPLKKRPGVYHAYHLYPVRIDFDALGKSKKDVFSALKAAGIYVVVHYPPVHLHPYYRQRFGYREGSFPASEKAYAELVSLPIFPNLTLADQEKVLDSLRQILG